MPRMNGTGPVGMGPMTGWGRGPCGERFGPLGWGRGLGRIMCGWFNRSYQRMDGEEKKELLRDEIADLKEELAIVKKELESLEKEK